MNQVMAIERLTELEQRHRTLAEQVAELGKRAFLTPEEQRQMTDLKKMKLAAKDELFALRRQSDPPAP
ncbi:MAG TPA: YdcH family protein [Polyangiaceae bacterium]|jgi:hypothetical protein